MSTNPYAIYVGDHNPATLIRQFPEKLSGVVAKLGTAGMDRSLAPGKWTAAEILCHLADCEIAFAFRWRQTLAENDHVVQPFDQDHWATHYASMSGQEALGAFMSLRRWNSLLLNQLAPEDWERRVTHPERGEMSFRTLVETMAGHDLHHLQQLEKIAVGAA
jgi:DinB superfamily